MSFHGHGYSYARNAQVKLSNSQEAINITTVSNRNRNGEIRR